METFFLQYLLSPLAIIFIGKYLDYKIESHQKKRAEEKAIEYAKEQEMAATIEAMKEGLSFELIRSGDRLYLVPTQDNDLFLKNNVDFRRDIKADNEVRTRDLYLMNYFSIYQIDPHIILKNHQISP